MAWSTIRRATEDDERRLQAAARRFAARHNILVTDGDDAALVVYGSIYSNLDDGPYLARLWRGCTRRALRESAADGIAYGYVGYRVA